MEWQKTATIQSCAQARDWCAQSRNLFTNTPPFANVSNSTAVLTGQLPGFADSPTRFQQDNVRFSQFSPNGVVLISGNPTAVSGFRFTDDGRDVEQYAFGYRGGSQTTQTTNGDGPPITDGTSMRSGNERKTVFTNFEFNFTERTTGYVQANYAKTEGVNRNTYTTSTNCVKFGSQGVTGIPSIAVLQGQEFRFTDISQTQQLQLRNNLFRAYLGNVPDPNNAFFGFNGDFRGALVCRRQRNWRRRPRANRELAGKQSGQPTASEHSGWHLQLLRKGTAPLTNSSPSVTTTSGGGSYRSGSRIRVVLLRVRKSSTTLAHRTCCPVPPAATRMHSWRT